MPQEFLRGGESGQKATKQPKLRFSQPKLLEVEPLPMQSLELAKLEEQIQLGAYSSMERTELYSAKFTFLDRLRVMFRRFTLLLSELLGKRRKLSKRSQQALLQLHYLANLLQTSVCLSEEEAIGLQAAFGRAYYNILYPSAKQKDEQEFFERQFASLLASMA
jgi:hypothetical protein